MSATCLKGELINKLFKLYFVLATHVKLTTAGVSACVAAVKSRPVLHYCVIIIVWSSGIMECTCMLSTFENGVPLMR